MSEEKKKGHRQRKTYDPHVISRSEILKWLSKEEKDRGAFTKWIAAKAISLADQLPFIVQAMRAIFREHQTANFDKNRLCQLAFHLLDIYLHNMESLPPNIKALVDYDLPKLNLTGLCKLVATLDFSPLQANFYLGKFARVASLAGSELFCLPIKSECISQLLTACGKSKQESILFNALESLNTLLVSKQATARNFYFNLAAFYEFITSTNSPDKGLKIQTPFLLKYIVKLSYISHYFFKKRNKPQEMSSEALEMSADLFLSRKLSAYQSARLLIAVGHLVQASVGCKITDKLKFFAEQVLIIANHRDTAKSLSLQNISNLLYGASLLKVTKKDLGHHLCAAFKSRLPSEQAKFSQERVLKMVRNAAEFIAFCKEPISKEMLNVILTDRPKIDPESPQHKIIEKGKKAPWMSNQIAVEEELVLIYFVDALVQAKIKQSSGETHSFFYIVEVDGSTTHRDPIDARHEELLLSLEDEEGNAVIAGIIRLKLSNYNNNWDEAVEDWQRQYGLLLAICGKRCEVEEPRCDIASLGEVKLKSKTEPAEELCYLAKCYEREKSDYLKALYYYQLAADQGSILACLRLGKWYERGDYGICKDDGAAFELYRQAAKSHQADAIIAFAGCYFKGVGVKKSFKDGVEILAASRAEQVKEKLEAVFLISFNEIRERIESDKENIHGFQGDEKPSAKLNCQEIQLNLKTIISFANKTLAGQAKDLLDSITPKKDSGSSAFFYKQKSVLLEGGQERLMIRDVPRG